MMVEINEHTKLFILYPYMTQRRREGGGDGKGEEEGRRRRAVMPILYVPYSL
jgi:hypothetical protein